MFANRTWFSTGKRLGRVFAIATGLLAPLNLSPASGMPSAFHTVTIHLQIGGGFHYRGTFSTSSNSYDAACFLRRTGRTNLYEVNYNAQVFRLVRFNRNAFELLLPTYAPGVRRYRGSAQEVDVAVGQHYFHGGLFGIRSYVDSSFHIDVRVGNGGLSGTFTAQHLLAQHGSTLKSLVRDRYFVTLQGSWSCSTLLRF
jgi:hypothetical protein